MKIVSTLTNVCQNIWKTKCVDTGKKLLTEYVMQSKIKDSDKNKILDSLKTITVKKKLDIYVANSLLKYE